LISKKKKSYFILFQYSNRVSVLGRREEKISMWNFFNALSTTIWFLLLISAFLVGTSSWIFEDQIQKVNKLNNNF
jgi:hypothetical protein